MEDDGVNAPSMVADIRPGIYSSFPDDFIVFDNELYFEATDGYNGKNCGSMMELMLQVWLLISILEVTIPILGIW